MENAVYRPLTPPLNNSAEQKEARKLTQGSCNSKIHVPFSNNKEYYNSRHMSEQQQNVTQSSTKYTTFGCLGFLFCLLFVFNFMFASKGGV